MPGPEVVAVLQTFAVVFTRPTFAHALVLLYGAILAPGRRTITATLRAVGLRDERHFTSYHRVFNRAVWSPLRVSRLLLELIVTRLLPPHAPVILVVDTTLVRRTGRRLVWKGRFHDAVRSQPGHIVTTEGIHWLCLAVLVPVPWSRRPWALPFLSIPTLTPATSAKLGRRHRTTPEYAAVLRRLGRRWQPQREIVVVGDSAFAVVELGHTCRIRGMRLISRLVLNAQLYDPVPPRPASTPGVPCVLGLFSVVVLLAQVLHPAHLPTRRAAWYAKPEATFIDALAAVRRHLWVSQNQPSLDAAAGPAHSTPPTVDLLIETACYAA
jgi:hypothetical protein